MAHYSTDDKQTMLLAAQARNKSRLQELINFAKLSGFTKLGIANCRGVQPYADKLRDLLLEAGFEVFSISCKDSGLNGAEIDEVLSGPSCDPVSQAEYLNACQTELNIEVGLCLGHGLLFSSHSHALVTTFLVKDFATKHKTVENLE
uniref:DUF1847 domain-containing protein n=1 Tax=uncultured Alphaproteobacteria bacterium TaxID=91750 RepID=A0A6G8F3A0_9PROT|nr:hypothetical protein PlAlph_6610 [uncultured Alphaproteobacteria bacterium]